MVWKNHPLSSTINREHIGLYRHDGLGLFRNLSGTQKERNKKQIIKLFKECNLTTTIDINLNIVNHLDVQLNVKDGTYKTYREPNNDRISEISSNENILNNATTIYENTSQ